MSISRLSELAHCLTVHVPSFVHQYGFLNRDVEVERTTLQHLHAAAHFFILPTHAETAGIVFAEAASHGLPVITRDVGGVSSMVNRNKNCILIDPSHGPELLADAVRPLLSEPERYKTMSEASLQLFAKSSQLGYGRCSSF